MGKGKRLEEMISKSRFKNVNQLSKETGVPYTTIKSFIDRNLERASIDSIVIIAKALNVSIEEIIEEKQPSNLFEASPRTVKIPILGDIACGDPLLAEENIKDFKYESPESLPSGNLYYLEAKGDSMEPTIPNGSYVLIREQSEVEYGEIAAVLVNGDTEATLKKVTKQGDTVLLMPINSSHEPIVITKDNPARVIGKAIRFTQDL